MLDWFKNLDPVVQGAIISGVVVIIILFNWWKKAKKQKNLEAEQTEKILNADLETIGNNDSTIEELEKKYE